MTTLLVPALDCMRKEIGNGQNTFLWFDPWLAKGRLVDLLDNIFPYLTGTLTTKSIVSFKMANGYLKFLLSTPYHPLQVTG